MRHPQYHKCIWAPVLSEISGVCSNKTSISPTTWWIFSPYIIYGLLIFVVTAQVNSIDNNFGALQPDGTFDGAVSFIFSIGNHSSFNIITSYLDWNGPQEWSRFCCFKLLCKQGALWSGGLIHHPRLSRVGFHRIFLLWPDLCPLLYFRNHLFIKFPGRDLGGILTFLKGFRTDTWTGCVILVLTLPAFLSCAYFILRSTGFQETLHYNYFWNLLIMLAGLAQQVTKDHI